LNDPGKQGSPQAERAASRRRAKFIRPGEAERSSSVDRAASPILLNLGYGNLVTASRVVAVVSPQSAPMKRLREEASSRGKLVDATQGRRTRSIIVTDSDHVILSAINPETIAARLAQEDVIGGEE
jgi:regulator of extracellular matrix RemA (YlzA/DUF370 family)